MAHFDYTTQGRRPSASQIVAAWRRAGKPATIAVTYGETYAVFDLYNGRWYDGGNGCRGVDRGAVVRALTAAMS